MSAILRKFVTSIPEELRPRIVEVVERTRGQIQLNQDDLSLLFDVYNTYLIPPGSSKEKMNCGGCRTKVVGWLRAAVSEFQASENG